MWCLLAAAVALAPTEPRWELGAMIGATLVDDENALGNAPGRDGIVDSGAMVGLRAGYAFTPAVSAELEGTYAQPGFAGANARARVLTYRAHGRVHLSRGRVRPFAVLGIGGAYLSTGSVAASEDADPELYWGIGARLEADRRVHLRLDLRHRIGPGRVETTSDVFEASLGIGVAL